MYWKHWSENTAKKISTKNLLNTSNILEYLTKLAKCPENCRISTKINYYSSQRLSALPQQFPAFNNVAVSAIL